VSGRRIIERRHDPARFAEVARDFPDPDDHPFMGEFGRRIHPTYFPPDSTADLSFAALRDQAPVLLVEATLDPTGAITRAGHAVRIQGAIGAAAPDTAAIEGALNHLVGLARALPSVPAHIEIEDLALADTMTPVGLWAAKHGGQPLLTPWPVIDLRRSEAELWRGVRKSYRSLIHWGERNLSLAYYNRETPGTEDLHDGLAFLIAQDVVLDPRTTSVYHDFLFRGDGECTVVRHQGRTVGCMIVIDEGPVGFYALGYCDHSGDIPAAHWPLWNAILRCRARGRARFDLYRVFFRGQERPGYRLGVALFKLGFTDTVRQRLVWRIPLAADGATLTGG
jgi:hypothetical protein